MTDLAAIERARERIGGHVVRTPTLPSRNLAARTGVEVWLKHETLQTTGSFKVRGALHKMLCLRPAQQRRGVVAASAGNHAQGVAFASAALDIPAVIVMPERTPQIKVDNTRAHGPTVEIVLHGATYDEAFGHARTLRAESRRTLIHPFDDPDIIAGQGTVGLEIVEDHPDLDVLLVPVGGGGLLAGVAAAVRPLCPDARIIGVQTEAAPAMARSLARGRRVRHPQGPTIAEGIAVSYPGAHALRAIRENGCEIVLVEEHAIEAAIVDLLAQDKAVVEGAGAATIAAFEVLAPTLVGRKVVALLSGGNIDLNRLDLVIERWLARRQRLVRLRVSLADRPGALAGLLGTVADQKANVVRVIHDRVFGSRFGEAEVVLTLEVRNQEHIASIVSAVERGGHHVGSVG